VTEQEIRAMPAGAGWTPVKRDPPPFGEQVLVAWGNCSVMVCYRNEDGLWRATLQVPNGEGMQTVVIFAEPPELWRWIPENPLNMTCDELGAIR
jgi:hypothetical protein